MIAGLLLGATAMAGAMLAARGRSNARARTITLRQRDRCAVAIVLFVPTDAEGRIVDQATGSAGFSHAALDGCEVDDTGAPVLIDCRPAHGIHRRRVADYGVRPRVYLYLDPRAGAETYGCARARVGEPFDALGLVLPRTGPGRGAVCSQAIAECLPARLRDRIATAPGRVASPNDIARAFGARANGPDLELTT